MPSKKQRRRREKSRRHEYEYVYVDEDGTEVEVEPEELRKPARSDDRAGRSRGGRAGTRSGRRIEPPSWTRVGKRGLIFAPLMFLTVSFLSKGLSVTTRLYQTAFLLAFFLPFSYLMDSIMYRSSQRRTGAAPSEPRRKRGET
ncbi:MAG TPA: hypothetical protein VF101_04645 [Gaiellaceae bacterium]